MFILGCRNGRFSGREPRVLPALPFATAEDRYDDNEDKRGAKFLVGIADRARYRSLDQSESDVWRRRSSSREITTYFSRN